MISLNFINYINLILIILIALSIYVTINLLYLKFISKKPVILDGPMVSVLIPARDEENNLKECIESLLNQSYLNYEIIILDDNSSDKTFHIAKHYSNNYNNLRVLKGKHKKTGWLGKSYAMKQLAQHAKGELIFFTDADTLHKNDSIAWAATNLIKHNVDALSGFTYCKMKSFGEQLVLPIVFIPIKMFFPIWLVKNSKSSYFSLAIGQYFMFKKETYDAIGGHEFVKDKITEDVFMARYVKDMGYKIIFMDGSHHIAHRSYEGFQSSIKCISKNVVDAVGNKYFFLLPVLAFYFFAFVLPSFFWINSFLYLGIHFYQLTIILLIGLYLTFIILHNHGFKFFIKLIFPVIFLITLYTVLKSITDKVLKKNIVWKGRIANGNH